MYNVARVALAVEAPACLRHAVLAGRAPRYDPLLSRRVNGVSVAAAMAGACLEGVKGARRRNVTASHLQLNFAQGGRVSAVGSLQHHRAKAQVLASQRGAFSGVQRSGNATTHGGSHARSSLVHERSCHCVCECVEGGVVCVEKIYLCRLRLFGRMSAPEPVTCRGGQSLKLR